MIQPYGETILSYALEILLGESCGLAHGKLIYENPVNTNCFDNEPILFICPSDHLEPPSPPLSEIDGVPLLFGQPVVERRGRGLVVWADIVASTFFLVTRYEEIARREARDGHGRFPGRESLPFRAGFLNRPIVEEYGDLLRKWLREVGLHVPPPRREFSVLLTHDVDHLRKYERPLRTMACAAAGLRPRRDLGECLRVVSGLSRDPYDRLDEMLGWDDVLRVSAPSRVKNVCFFPVRSGYPLDARFDLNDPIAKTAIECAIGHEAEIGLHASYAAGLDPSRIRGEKERLELATDRPVISNRHHYLSWREPEDGAQLRQAGITEDSTLGYPDVPGFRLGVCRPIPLFDPVRMEPMGIIEHPLTLMDITLSGANYLNASEEAAWEIARDLIETVRRHRGELVLLWHNSSLAPTPGNYHPSLYRRILEKLKQHLAD
ncbi:hypothetical protein HQ520_11720 [bacterium]|nr:hypothetical protein [bacterium]